MSTDTVVSSTPPATPIATAVATSVGAAVIADIDKDVTGFFGKLKATFAAGLAPAARVATITFLVAGFVSGCVFNKVF